MTLTSNQELELKRLNDFYKKLGQKAENEEETALLDFLPEGNVLQGPGRGKLNELSAARKQILSRKSSASKKVPR